MPRDAGLTSAHGCMASNEVMLSFRESGTHVVWSVAGSLGVIDGKTCEPDRQIQCQIDFQVVLSEVGVSTLTSVISELETTRDI